MSHDYPKLSPKTHPSGKRYLVRESWIRDSLYEIFLIEWSKGGRPKVRHVSGSETWIKTDDLPEVVERLANSTSTASAPRGARQMNQQRGCPVSVSLGSSQSPKRIDATKSRKKGGSLGDERKVETRREPVCAERQSSVTSRRLLAPLAAVELFDIRGS